MHRMKSKDKPEGKRLSSTEVIVIAKKAAEALDIKLPTDNALLSRFNKSIPIPLMLGNDKVQFWVDKYYIAYSFHENDTVKYLYITKHHIDEEEKAYKNASLPKCIRNDFIIAKAKMTKSEKSYAIFEKRIVKFT